MELEIAYLSDHPLHLPLLVGWFNKEWGGQSPTATVEGFTERLKGRMNRNHPPITFVALQNDAPVGTAALKIREMETHQQYEFWLGSVYVCENFRNRGIASALINSVIDKAAHLEIGSL